MQIFITKNGKLYINYQLDAPIIIYLVIKYYFPLHVSSHKCSSSGGYIVYMQHMVQLMVASRYTA